MALKKQLPKKEKKQLADYEIAYLFDDPHRLVDKPIDKFYFDQLTDFPEEKSLDMEITALDLLKENGAVYLEKYIEQHPGTRPAWWWQQLAPEPRKMVAGKGVPAWEKLAIMPRYQKGTPISMVIPSEDKWPFYESEANYLNRNNLLSPGEKKKLTQADFQATEEAECSNSQWILDLKIRQE